MNMEHMNAALESIAELARTLKEERDIARLERDEAIADYQRVYKERDEAREAILYTLEENRHLADGDDCTLAKLKSVVPYWK